MTCGGSQLVGPRVSGKSPVISKQKSLLQLRSISGTLKRPKAGRDVELPQPLSPSSRLDRDAAARDLKKAALLTLIFGERASHTRAIGTKSSLAALALTMSY